MSPDAKYAFSSPDTINSDNKGIGDRIEQFNWFRDMKSQEFPETIMPFFDEVKAFTEKVHNVVLFNVLRRECIPNRFIAKANRCPGHRSLRSCARAPYRDIRREAQI